MSMNPADIQKVASAATDWVGHAVLFGTLLAGLTWVGCRTVLRRAPLVLHSALWMIVLAKFLIPAGPSWSWSLATATRTVGMWWHAAPTVEAQSQASPAEGDIVLAMQAPATAAGAAVIPASVAPAWRIAAILGAAYLVCLATLIGARLTAYVMFVRRCRRLPQADLLVSGLVDEICARLGVHRRPRVLLSDEAPAPYVFGAWRPTLVLSRSHLVRPDELEAVILHEIAHLRRGDLFVRYVQWLAGTVFFFWPVVAWVNRRIDLARESACDEWALRHGKLSAAEYARCLLRALHRAPAGHEWRSVRFRLPVYAPAAMAANLATVERRIEMILETPMHRSIRGSLGIPAAMLLAAWAGFALTGAAVAQSAAQDDKKEKDKDVIIVTQDEPAAAEQAPAGKRQFFVHHVSKGNGADDVVFARIGSEKELQEFLTAHPTADANGDGKLSQTEHDAFLVALAMSDPAAVLARFPQADRNKDGQLDENEAARLVGGVGNMFYKAIARPGEGAAVGVAAGERHEIRRSRLRKMVVNHGGTPTGGPVRVTVNENGGAGKWLLENITAQPTARDVAKCIKAVEDAPLAAFYEMHPEADTNGDGKVSVAERDAFMAAEHAKVRAMLLKKYPAADTNGDGVLSEEEMIAFAKSNGGMFWHSSKEDGNDNVIMIRGNDEPAGEAGVDLQVEVEVKTDKDTPAEGGGGN